MWYEQSVFYQIFPLGFCDAPKNNDDKVVPRIKKVIDWLPHITKLGADAVYFSPVFSSDSHGYDTRDYTIIDCRLGTNNDFAAVCKEMHAANIKVVLDGVFNHVGRGFWAFKDVCANGEKSDYKDWFKITFGVNNSFNDGFFYEGWEGHFELVELNLKNPKVCDYLFSCIKGWVEQFDIDGLRLDVAYSLDENFVKLLREFTDKLKPDFFLVGEIVHGDYNRLVNENMLQSCTNYECYKGLYSSFNSLNMFEIAHSISRQFGEDKAICKNMHLLNFVDNHDVSRIASILEKKEHLPAIYGLLFAMPGIPCIYYGSEWAALGDKKDGDAALRMAYDSPQYNDLTQIITKMAILHRSENAFCYGDYKLIMLNNKQYIFERSYMTDRIIVAINADDKEFDAKFNLNESKALELLTQNYRNFDTGCKLAPYSVEYWKI